ncbi:MAG: amino acid adenylation domain-containing protein [Gomphosphaeria aponina SAG 52.96 = DSM 107014]|uniref:Amino acid adenylation domain-containing protein n=1 Tax=Gomphosphaeria aponina SAG 52.96 = DSM 107014 TaxID=1521640 RepID=A0A941GV71_9CHRO|nr:amino acid adenylation domain-containing protein [Gomphosphaeria aponina SAG 52.96 = DSM 107014]
MKIDYPKDKCIHQLFEEQVERTPNNLAVVFENQQLTYGELNSKANQLAHYLQSLGVKPEVLVGICVERSLLMVIGLLGILKAGGAYVPLDPAYPAERLDYMMNNSQAQVLLTQEKLKDKIPVTNAHPIYLDTDSFDTSRENPVSGKTRDNLTYVIYTSGSTGQPKGVAMSDGSLYNLIIWQLKNSCGGKTLQFAPLSFDVSFQEIFSTLCWGATLVLVSETVRRDAYALLHLLREEKIARLFLPFVALKQLAEAVEDYALLPTCLREVITAGEQLQISPAIVRFFKELKGCRIHNHYGPSETHVVTAFVLPEAVMNWPALPPIGKAIANTKIYILDEDLQPVPLSVPGELYIGGAGLARGYLNRPELTNEKFIDNPFDSGKLYKTGDLARYLPDGNIEFLGRIDNQVKIRGFRIELGEIEATLIQHPAVIQAAVVPREDQPGNKLLVAYVVPATITVNELQNFLKEKLPEYLIPSAFVFLDALPLTPNGKVDRRALPAPAFAELQQTYVVPSTPIEERLAEIWASVFGLNRVGVEDNFFELGGHSLLATQIISRVRKAFAVELSLSSLFSAPTIICLSKIISSAPKEMPQKQVPPSHKKNENLPLSFAQQQLWVLDQLVPNSPMYNIPLAYRLTGELNVTALKQSFNEIVRRHESLRTNFLVVDGQPIQAIAPELDLKFPVIDLRKIPETELEAEVQRLATQEAQQPFDLTQGPLLRLQLLNLAATEHILLLTIHHIVADGWSLDVLRQELAVLYAAFSTGKSSLGDATRMPLRELPIQYADFVIWQREFFKEIRESQLAYWKQQLHGELPVLELPTDRPRPKVQTYQGAIETVILPKNLTDSLKTLSQQEGVTLFSLLLAAFGTLLYRYSRQEDIIVGISTAGRNQLETEGLIGLFVNVLAIRSNFAGNPTLRQLVRQVHKVTLEAYEHQDLPLEQLVKELKPERDLSRAPIFQVMFTFQNASRQPRELPGLTMTPERVHSGTSKFDITLDLQENSEDIRGEFAYNTDLFEAATIARMVGHFQTLLENIVAEPAERISDLGILTAAEQHQLLEEWNNTQTDYPQDKCIHQLFEAQVERTPNAVAVVWENQQLTYQELNQRANQLAHYIKALGVKEEVLVGVCQERSPNLIVSLLAILKAGGAYVPLDPNYPRERLAFMLADAQVPVLLTQQSLLEKLPENQAHVVCLDRDWEVINQENQENPSSSVEDTNLAYVLYTSGSTGLPKGVGIEHHNTVNFINWAQGVFNSEQLAGVLASTSICFDLSVFEIFVPLCCGGKVIMAENALHLPTLKNAQKVTLINTVPSAIAELLRTNGLRDSVRTVNLAGEPLSQKLIDQLYQKETIQEVFNLYGPTEATIYSTFTLCKHSPSIGRPISNTQIYILDSHLKPVPIGVPGELYIGGAGLARGYFNRPELTSEKFIPNPFDNSTNSRLYKTGDLARYLSDGNIEFLGRIDNQVKIRGFRIELGEIEAVLNQHPNIQQTVVIAREDLNGDKNITAYLVPQQNQTLTLDEIRNVLKQKLPNYMIPSAFVFLEKMPLTPNGKIDRRALPAPDKSQRHIEPGYIEPRNQTEEILANIWSEILGIEKIGINDNFFELGGHSLLATQIISRAREILNREIPLRQLFEAPTLKEFSQIIETSKLEKTQKITKRKIDTNIPLSFAQERLWFLNQLEGSSATYNIPGAIKIKGKLQITALEKALNTIVQRHEILRTSFVRQNGVPMQVIANNLNIFIKILESTEIEKIIQEFALQPFELETVPNFRATLLKEEEESFILLFNMHHIISDGWSMGILMRELSLLYKAYSEGEEISLPELPIQYADFTLWQRSFLTEELLAQQLSYWKNQLTGIPPLLELPLDKPRPSRQTFTGKTIKAVINPELTQKLKNLSKKSGSTLYMTLLAAFNILLDRYSGQSDLVVGSPIANRNRSEIEELIGFFVNTLVIRTKLEGNPSFLELLNQVRKVTLDAYAHQDLPFEKLVEELQPERSLSYHPLFQVMFVLQNAPMNEISLGDLTVSELEIDSVAAKFDLTLSLVERESNLIASWEYNTDLFAASTIERMIGHFQNLLTAIVDNPKEQVTLLPILSEREKQQILVDWNDTETEYPQNKCIHELFEEQVERTPNNVAVVFEDQKLTYGELNSKANQLAHYLQTLGVTSEVLVGICVERSIEMIVGLLGILKAGGAYVPLDPHYPKERLAYMLKDAKVNVLLTQERLIENLPEKYSGNLVCLEKGGDVISQYNEQNPPKLVNSENLAYVLYTSGSTGLPKGVSVNHNSVKRLVKNTNYINIHPLDKIAQIANTSFDAATFEIWGALLNGAKLVIFSKETTLQLELFVEQLKEKEIDTIFLTTALFNQIARIYPQAFKTLKDVLFGGEKVEPKWVKEIIEQGKPENLIHVYGPTENTTFSTWYSVNNVAKNADNLPIGKPINKTKVYILDTNLQPTPIGVPGEIHLAGDGLARGYLNRPELTAEKFIDNPFDSGKLYKTGDLARYLPDGNIEYIGRIDNQVKIRGFRIELGEIEATLTQHPTIEQTVIIVREDNPGDKRLIAYIIAKQNQTIILNQLRQFLMLKLPDYMIPSAFVCLEKLPLTPNRKIDRKALPKPDFETNRENEFIAPRNQPETELAQIWQKVLGIEKVSINDNFFELGGHSLLAVRLFAEIEKAFNKKLPLAALFQSPTIKQLAAILRQEGWLPTWTSLVPIQPNGSNPPFFFINSISYAKILGKVFNSEQPFYCLNIFGLTELFEKQLEQLTIEELAKQFVKDMRLIQPEGPYFLGTYCGDSILTIEIAQQLQAVGQKVALLAFIDVIWEPQNLGWHFYRHNLNKFGLGYIPVKLKHKLEFIKDRLIIKTKNLMGKFYKKNKQKLSRNLQDVQLLEAFYRATDNYEPKIYSGQITLFLSSEYQIINSSKLASLIDGEVEIQEINHTYHHLIFEEPHVQVLAEKLKACIDQAIAN